MIHVEFYDKVEEEKIAFVVICAIQQGKWIWVKHKERDTLEIPGGHREQGEAVIDAARRELQEETGALVYTIESVGFYSVKGKTRVNENGQETFGSLYYACVETLGDIDSEIESVFFLEELPTNLTYPSIQPLLLQRVQTYKNDKKLDNQ